MLRKGDYKRDLVDYIKRNLKKGYTEDSLKWALVNQGNSKIEVERAIEIGIYRAVNYSVRPVEYCGLKVDYNPLFS